MPAPSPTVGLIPVSRLRIAKSHAIQLAGIKPLQDSIGEYGLQVPLLVRPVGANLRFKDGVWDCDYFDVVLGYRRLHCLQKLEYHAALCVIQEMSFRKACQIRNTVAITEGKPPPHRHTPRSN